MAAKILYSLTDDNLDLQKQIGCMNGILHIFDRHPILSGERRLVGHTGKGIHHDFNGEGESNEERLSSKSTEKNPTKSNQERQRIASESSRASLASLSRSSSSSSLDCIRAAHFDRIIFPETPSRDRDIRHLVKDSMYRDIHSLSFKAKTSEEAADPAMRFQDSSPRLHAETNRNSHASVLDLKESLRVVAKVQESPPKHQSERRRLVRSLSYNARDEAPSLNSRDAPRFSYDGREVGNRAPFDSRDASKSTLKLRDLPRLSLDCSKDGKVQNVLESSPRPPSVVAKLMGLESLPQSVSSIVTNSTAAKSYPDREPLGNNSRPFLERDRSSVTATSSPKKSWKEPHSPRWKNPMEPAPWKHTEGRRSSPKPLNAESGFPSVYSEIEKRLKDLEFTQSGKDLRALKQILEALQSKKSLQTQQEIRGSNCEEKQSRSKHEARPVAVASTKRVIVSARNTESPIVIMKPAKPFVVSSASAKNNRALKATQTSTRSQLSAKDGGYGGVGKSSGSISPRLLQKKLELERRARPPTPPDSSKSRKQPSKQLGESNSPGGRRRPKHSIIQESDVIVESRSSNYCENESVAQSNASASTHEKSPRTSSCTSPSGEGSESTLSVSTEKMRSSSSNEEKSNEFGTVPVEYSSPVSVLDNRVHKEDSDSSLPYKDEISMDKEKGSSLVRGNSADTNVERGFKSEINQNKLQSIESLVRKLRRLNSGHDEASTDYIASLCENTDPDHRYVSEILLASGLLLRDLGSSLVNFQFHPSGHAITPQLFLVLEQTKTSTAPTLKGESSSKKKVRRRLVFDTVNEILGRKLVATEPWLRRLRLTRTAMNGQKLLREVCSEIKEGGKEKCSSLREGEEDERWKEVVWKDVMHRESEWWTNFDDEISGAVLDIERSIFKDLVNEVVIGESGLRTKAVAKSRPFGK